VQPVPAIPAARLRQLVSDLDSPRFKDREAASHELAELDEQAERALADALKAKPSAETRRRIETLLDRPRLARKPEVRRGLRSIEALEHIGTSEAREVLGRLAGGDPESSLTQQAKSTLERLRQRLTDARK
jgi:hypothetical protein